MTDSDKLLIVDDDHDQRELVEAVLKGVISPKRVIYATDGQDGLVNAVTSHPHVILTDLNMPLMKGDQLIREVRGIRGYMPKIILSSDYKLADILHQDSVDGVVKQWLQDGDIEFLHKDFDFNVYSKALESLVTQYLLPAGRISEVKLP